MSSENKISREEWEEKMALHSFSRKQMNEIVMNYLLIEGFKMAAEKFSEETGLKIEDGDLESINERLQIRECIQNGEIKAAIRIINRVDPELLDDNKEIFFELLIQQLIEMIRIKELDSALDFAQTYLSEHVNVPSRRNKMQKALSLLAFEQPDKSPYKDLLSMSHRLMVASSVNAAILASRDKPSVPHLATLVKTILWSQEQLETIDKKKAKRCPKLVDIGTAKFDY